MEVQLRRADLAISRCLDSPVRPLAAGDVRVKVERFALTSNNVTYGRLGDALGYWDFFAAPDEWGILPVWGIGEVVETLHADIAVRERLFGYFPMAGELTLTPSAIKPTRLRDASAHRASLPAVYNSYARTGAAAEDDNARCLLYPLYATSFCIADFLSDNDVFDAKQIVMTSAASKTAIGTAMAVRELLPAAALVGMTSSSSRDFVEGTGAFDLVVDYARHGEIAADVPTVVIDLAGDGARLANLVEHLGASLRHCLRVGFTHGGGLVGMAPADGLGTMFMAPDHIRKRARDWGPGEFDARATSFWRRAAETSQSWLKIAYVDSLPACEGVFHALRTGRAPVDHGYIVWPNGREAHA
jgi:hypothetical protein